MGIIKLKNMQFYGYHGVYEHEKKLGTPFEVDVEVTSPFSEAASTDDINLTVNYDQIFKLVEDFVVKTRYNLIETLANKIADKILEDYDIHKVIVRVRKPKVQIKGILDTVEVETKKSKHR